ncbi:DUF485 domain-containing protein [Actinocrispum wychmicini]|uniref:Uncharacterized membrane protein (DUF485 family) n=1 Tax=Actinocrispum wychmicini TaxID=1213861 RepID=A0A4R2J6K5_9PSEU|nr:DUF485 domain-containing protein [Actinocrispum wychmicini]TCO53697.1 uncharacterized membrane protein (DUF485 family) [Actinocrispum wychmicini]
MKTVPSFSEDHDFPPPEDPGPDFTAIHRSPEFIALRRRLTRFVLPMTGLFLTWYLTYVLLAAYAHDFMSTRVFGNITVGLLLGLSQFLTTVAIMLGYLRFARRTLDPAIAELRAGR